MSNTTFPESELSHGMFHTKESIINTHYGFTPGLLDEGGFNCTKCGADFIHNHELERHEETCE